MLQQYFIAKINNIVSNQNLDPKGNAFKVHYIFTNTDKTFTAYDTTPGIELIKDSNNNNSSFKFYYKENIKNGKIYRNCTKIELVETEQTNTPFISISQDNKTVDTESLIKTVEKESKNILDKKVSELSKDEELQAFKLILAELIKGINKINKTLDNLVVSNTISKTLTPTPFNKEIVREPVDVPKVTLTSDNSL